MKMPVRMDAVTLAGLIRARGVQVPEVEDDEAAAAHFGTPKVGDRYLTAETPKKLMVWDGAKWIQQATCN